MIRRKIMVRGVVQGVGFRPFVYRLATGLGLTGCVRNTTSGVEIDIEGGPGKVGVFIRRLNARRPPASRIDQVLVRKSRPRGRKDFVIASSAQVPGFTQISPDIAVCRQCRREFRDRRDRRHLFPFINCTNCGPRYSIIAAAPYDRRRTAMRRFRMCPACRREFGDVSDRRFHAQPDCCFVCGPSFSLTTATGQPIRTADPIQTAAGIIRRGGIIAVKGIGGFHIACDARNAQAVEKLRRLKRRPTKPLAIMARESDIRRITRLNPAERAFLRSPAAPVVLLEKKNKVICAAVAPRNPYLGVMLPYAPVHDRLLDDNPYLVMTSANLRDEPVAIDDGAVHRTLRRIVSHILTHDRPIINRCDDSVGFIDADQTPVMIRRSRGYAPTPVALPDTVRPTLAVGPQLKNTFTLARGRDAYVSPHIGDLDNRETLAFFRETLGRYRRWFKIKPEVIAYDLHPDYLSTRLARTLPGKRIAVQHHEAHIAACLGENGLDGPVIGIAFDGTGYGHDGRIWGGEFFVGGSKGMERVGHLEYLPLPGGETSIARPYRIALAYGWLLLGREVPLPNPVSRRERTAVRSMVERGFNLAYTSSMGRLFDAAAGLLGIMPTITYEAEAAIALEHRCRPDIESGYPYRIDRAGTGPFVIRLAETFQAILDDRPRRDPGVICARFHHTVVRFSLDISRRLRTIYGVNRVCLSGGVFQNRVLLHLMTQRLRADDFQVFSHHQLPTNDACISYGQVILANNKR